MPRVTLYIREDDYDKWKLIKNKAELVSQAINRSEIHSVIEKNGKAKLVHRVHPPEDSPTVLIDVNTNEREIRAMSYQGADMARKKYNFCPKGHAIPDGRSKCMGKGCKYA